MSKFEVRGKNVLITGAASGIGREFSSLFAADGANLVLDDLPAKKTYWLNGPKSLPVNTISIPGHFTSTFPPKMALRRFMLQPGKRRVP